MVDVGDKDTKRRAVVERVCAQCRDVQAALRQALPKGDVLTRRK